MPRRKAAARAADTEATQTEPDAQAATAEASNAAPAEARQPVYATDPNPVISVALSDHQGGPSAHLLRSHRFRQMQVRFDGEYPDERYLEQLAKAGWKDRTESEGVWTKQIDPQARWQSVQQMEQEFKAVVNDIRKEKGLAPALEGMAMA